MLPDKFPESNFTYTAPPSMPDCQDLPVYRDAEQIISCWQMTPAERMRAFIEGRIWLGVVAQIQVPVYLTPFRPFHSDDESAENLDKERFCRLMESKIRGFLISKDLPLNYGGLLEQFCEFLLTEG